MAPMRDIREVDTEHYWEELRQRWGALLSYRYIGRQFSSMNNVEDNAVAHRVEVFHRKAASRRLRKTKRSPQHGHAGAKMG